VQQYRFNPEAIHSNPSMQICPHCGGKYIPRDFSGQCPVCKKIESYLLDEKKPKKIVQIKL